MPSDPARLEAFPGVAQVRAAGFVGLHVEIQEGSDEVLVDGGDLVLRQTGSSRKACVANLPGASGGCGVAAHLLPGVFVGDR
jgi:hypothetical protein